jgi:hypothetical protein
MIDEAMKCTWHVSEIRGGLCTIWRADGLIKPQAVLRSGLKQRMIPLGVVTDIFDNLCRQLDAFGRATVIGR